MAYIKGTYPQLIGGLSEQVPQARQPNQVQAQLNMLSDPVTGPRRRGSFQKHCTLSGLANKEFKSEVYEVGGDIYSITVRTDTGVVYVYAIDAEGYAAGQLLETYTTDYLKASKPTSIKFSKHGSGIVILNTEKVVQEGSVLPETSVSPDRQAYFYIQQGQLDREFIIEYQLNNGSVYTVSWTTPKEGANGATPEKVAQELQSKLKSHGTIGEAQGWIHDRVGAYVYSRAPSTVSSVRTRSPMGDNFIVCSNRSNTVDSSKLPARLPASATGYVVRVGKYKEHSYFEWDYANTRWNERAAYNLRKPLNNLPLIYDIENSNLRILSGEGRLAGDEENAPNPHFVGKKITGVGSFQGRLILLCKEYVFFSSSKDEMLWRKSAASLADDDPIEIAGVTSYGLSYKYAVPFMGDLLIMSESAQAMIPGSSVLTPRNASLTIASEYQMNLETPPVHTGKSLIYSAFNTSEGSALWEMVPSEYSNRNLYAQDITEHIPSLYKGKVRDGAVLETAGYIFHIDDSNTMKIHQYLWAGPDKVHSSFSEWKIDSDIIEIHAAGTSFWVVVQGYNDTVNVLRWQHTSAPDQLNEHLDRLTTVEVIEVGKIKVPKSEFSEEDLLSGKVQILQYTEHGTPFYTIPEEVKSLSNELWEVQSEYLYTPVGGEVKMGYLYTSIFQPTAPVLRDYYGQPILLDRAVLHNLSIAVESTGVIKVHFKDAARAKQVHEVTPYRLYTTDIDGGEPHIGSGVINIPLRIDLRTAEFWLESSGPNDMWITGVEYGYRHNQRHRRVVMQGQGG